MRRLLICLAILAASACSDRVVDGEGSGAATGSTSEASATSTATASSTSTSTGGSAAQTTDLTTTGSGSTGQPLCQEGIFRGQYFSGFEASYVELCSGGVAWSQPSGLYPCDDVWVEIEGTLCGPGSYGHLGYYDYELSGTVINGPCLQGSCGGELSSCGNAENSCYIAECDWTQQDCPDGAKCVPNSPSGEPPWTYTVCTGYPPDFLEIGAVCDKNPDLCGAGAFCWSQDFAEPQGVCVQLCKPNEAPCMPGTCVDCTGSINGAGGSQLGMCLPTMCGNEACAC